MKITIPIEIDTIVERLPLKEKIRLVQRLERETWAARMDRLFRCIDQRRGRQHLSEQEIVRICKDVRRQLHARGRP